MDIGFSFYYKYNADILEMQGLWIKIFFLLIDSAAARSVRRSHLETYRTSAFLPQPDELTVRSGRSPQELSLRRGVDHVGTDSAPPRKYVALRV
jgi:hypothetical protein